MNKSPIKKEYKLKIYVDGTSRGNPGPATSAFLLVHNDTVIHEEIFKGEITLSKDRMKFM